MILRLKIQGFLVTGDTEFTGWEYRVAKFFRRPLPELQPSKKRCSSGVPLKWLCEEFHQCPLGANEATMNYHCRAWVLHMFGTVLFPDCTGDTALSMYILCLLN